MESENQTSMKGTTRNFKMKILGVGLEHIRYKWDASPGMQATLPGSGSCTLGYGKSSQGQRYAGTYLLQSGIRPPWQHRL